ncbi:nicotinate-nucleotide--dimethylbenzimidazole phosphoribosyltransferase [uncultured Tyzzerella sp.]|uniref:nicotinate-nucleotide--dimethylbenzimidazole phosphoribosyltransferase n=1 Tax=uncultured Tyzzerella sp. TaxID=2321398 RepID=UPI002943600F|nr:nicotinate-nucleotide--dimethylbenzimidazole phosphoribosyltransferase [uncultured Tyzzerella sp.]
MENYLKNITKTNKHIYNKAKEHIDFLAKPLGSLGELEEIPAKLCSIYNTLDVNIDKKAIIVLASDNGVFEEGIASTPQDVTAIQTINILEGKTGVGVIAKQFNTDILVCDVGVKYDINHSNIINKKIRKSTNNFAKEEAMTKEEAIKSINIGIELVNDAKKNGYKIIGTGEMGIGNTTTSSAILASILGLKEDEIQKVVGVGAGLTKEAYNKKLDVIKNAIKKHKPNPNDVIDIIQKVGGFDIGAMIGVYIGCAYNKIPVVVDGFIAIVSALCAIKLNENIKEYMFLSHKSMEKGYVLAQENIGLPSYLDLKMRLGEGSGCPIMFSIMDLSLNIFKNMATFDEAKIDTEYLKDLK